ncbi:hypothetical protein Tco_1038136 [Tanacetum coccineum]
MNDKHGGPEISPEPHWHGPDISKRTRTSHRQLPHATWDSWHPRKGIRGRRHNDSSPCPTRVPLRPLTITSEILGNPSIRLPYNRSPLTHNESNRGVRHHEITRLRYLDKDEGASEASVDPGDGRNFVENKQVCESLLLMKFYSLSRGVVSCLLSGREVDLPMQGFEGESSQSRNVEVVEDPKICNPSVFRQLFVTLSPRLCHAVKQHISHLLSISCNENSPVKRNLDDVDGTFRVQCYPGHIC